MVLANVGGISNHFLLCGRASSLRSDILAGAMFEEGGVIYR